MYNNHYESIIPNYNVYLPFIITYYIYPNININILLNSNSTSKCETYLIN